MADLKKLNAHTRKSWVRPSVRENEITKVLIDAIFPYYPEDTKCIGGFLDAADQYWKVNFHWENLLARLTLVCGKIELDAATLHAAQQVKTKLLTNPPVPRTGYVKDKNMGDTRDRSSLEKLERRHTLLRQCKAEAEKVFVKAGVVDAARKRDPLEAEKPWWLAVAPVARPGTSQHGTGWALDIKGTSNARIESISKALGATLAYNEASHLHVEFANWKDTVAKANPALGAGARSFH